MRIGQDNQLSAYYILLPLIIDGVHIHIYIDINVYPVEGAEPAEWSFK